MPPHPSPPDPTSGQAAGALGEQSPRRDDTRSNGETAGARGGHTESQDPSALPGPVGACIARIAGRLLDHNGVISVVLLGSAARGELVCAQIDGRLEVFGDLEFLAITGRRLPQARRLAMAGDVHDMGVSLGCRNPLFHAEVLIRERRRLPKMLPLIFTNELRVCGRVLAGVDLLSEIPAVTAQTLDRRNTHEILMKRLWALAEAVPGLWLDQRDLPELPARTLSVAAARNALDVPTVLLPEAGVLLPTYAARVEYWATHAALPFRAHIDQAVGGDSSAWLVRVLADRRAAIRSPDLAQSHRVSVAALEAALGWLLKVPVGSSPGAVAEAVVRNSRALYHEVPISPGELVGLITQARAVRRDRGLGAATRWTAAARKGRLTAALLALHGSLGAWQGLDESGARTLLDTTWAALGPLAEPAATPGNAFPSLWRDARRAIARAWWRAIRLGDPVARRRLEEALWHD